MPSSSSAPPPNIPAPFLASAPKKGGIPRLTGAILSISLEELRHLTPKIQLIILTAKDKETERFRQCFQTVCVSSDYELGFFGPYLALHCQTGQGGHEASSKATQLLHDIGHTNEKCMVLMLGMAYGLRRSPDDQTQVTGGELLQFFEVMKTRHVGWQCEGRTASEWQEWLSGDAANGNGDGFQLLPLCFTPETGREAAKEKQQRIGDVLFATEIRALGRYNQGKLKPLDTSKSVASELKTAAEAVQRNWQIERKHQLAYTNPYVQTKAKAPWLVKAHLGLMLAGDSIIGDMISREAFRQEYQDAIGGEMEGAGLQTAVGLYDSRLFTGSAKVMLIKGIMDWGVAKNDLMQNDAVDNALHFTFDLLENLEKQAVISAYTTKHLMGHKKRQSILKLLFDLDLVSEAAHEAAAKKRLTHFKSILTKIKTKAQPQFVGRHWLRAWVRNEESKPRNYIVLEAPPGTGKSAFLRRWVLEKVTNPAFTARNYLVYYAITPNTDTPESVIEQVIRQIEAQGLRLNVMMSQAQRLRSQETIYEQFKRVIDVVSSQLEEEAKLYIYIDSLDSVRGSSDEGLQMLRAILTDLPPSVIVLLTSRPRKEGWSTGAVMEIDAQKADNEEDIKIYIRQNLKRLGLSVSASRVQQLADKCAGCFAYAEHLLSKNDADAIEKSFNTLPEGFQEYTNDLWSRVVPRFQAAGVPIPIAAGLLGLVALNHAVLTTKEFTTIVKQAAKEFAMPCFGLTAGTEFTAAESVKHIKSFLSIAQDFFAVTHGKKQDAVRMFHNAFGEYVIDELLDDDEADFCRIFLANYRSFEVRLRVYDEFSNPYELEKADFIETLSNLLIALSNVRDNPRRREELPDVGHLRYVAPVCWYLYGHFWWDEYDPSFPLCTHIIDLMAENKERYRDPLGRMSRTFEMVLQELKWIRSHWPRVSVWRMRRASCSHQLEANLSHWHEAQTHLDALCSKLALDIPLNKLDSKLTSADEFKAAGAISTNLRAECAYGQGNIEAAITLFRRALTEHEKVQFLDWCIPYSHGELAEVLLDGGQWKEAAEHVHIACTIWDNNIGTDDEDNLGLGEAYRFYGDLLWKAENQQAALEADILSLYYMFLGHADADTFSDGYCRAFHLETAWSVMDRLSEWFFSGPKDEAAASAVRLREFWGQYWAATGAPVSISLQECGKILAEIPREASTNASAVYHAVDSICADILYPRVPNLNEKAYEEIVNAVKESKVMTTQVESLKASVEKSVINAVIAR